MAKNHKYYTLIGINRQTDRAEIMFGSHLRSEVKFEQEEEQDKIRLLRTESYYSKTTILTHVSDNQNQIFADVADFELTHRLALPISNPNRIQS